MRSKEFHGRGQDRHARGCEETATRLLQAQELEVIALEERDIEKSNGPQMKDGDRLPEPVGIHDEPDIVFSVPRPVERRDAVIERHEAQGAIGEAPEELDEKRACPTGN